MKRIIITLQALVFASALHGETTLKVVSDKAAADNITGVVVASGHVHAATSPVSMGSGPGSNAAPLSLLADLVRIDKNEYDFSPGTTITTCTNDEHSLHWTASGKIHYRAEEGDRAFILKDVTFRLFDVPVMWLPYWYYPLDTDYGWRVMPGYTSRWGAYIMTRYVCTLAGGWRPGEWGLGSSTRFDIRSKNGVAFGENLTWQMGDWGVGKFRVYYLRDEDQSRYSRHWEDQNKYNYSNWGSEVPRNRYVVSLDQRFELTERDTVRLTGAYYSDSQFSGDFLRDSMFGSKMRYVDGSRNEIAWEHIENPFGLGVSVSGPLNEFYGGVSRLPEVYLDIAPQPFFALPVNYESQTRVGFLNRDYAKLGDNNTRAPYRYNPGVWADYQTFRGDTYHRFTLPFKVADVVSVVPRIGLRGTYWDETGSTANALNYRKAGEMGNATRSIVEGGVTFAARGTAWIDEDWQHMLEPYFDVLAQEAHYSGLKKGRARPYIFDSVDASRDWLDQYAGRSRNLPYSWYGVTPGVRNVLRQTDDDGILRTVADIDLYAAVQFNETSWTEGDRYHKLVRNPDDPNYGKTHPSAAPGMRLRFFPDNNSALISRVEYDTDHRRVAYADVAWVQRVTKDVKYSLTYSARDHRIWDFSSTPYDHAVMKNEDFNWAHLSYLRFELEHEICDRFAWGPFISWDFNDSSLDEIGTWFDIRTDCLGFRLQLSYENSCTRVDYSRYDDDFRIGIYIYLRAFGADTASPIYAGRAGN